MILANDLSQFKFVRHGLGYYVVTYTTPKRGDYWRANITDKDLINATKNADYVTTTAIRNLRKTIRRVGVHYRKGGLKY